MAHGSTTVADPARRPDRARRWLPRFGVVVAAWAALPKIISPPFRTASANEIADHVLPALVVLAVSLWALIRGRAGRDDDPSMFTAGMVVLLTGFWMAATHLPLVSQAMRHEAPWPATVYHTLSAAAVLGFGVAWSMLHWGDESGPEP